MFDRGDEMNWHQMETLMTGKAPGVPNVLYSNGCIGIP